MFKKTLSLIFISFISGIFLINSNITFADTTSDRESDFNELRDINIGTFYEYGYKITEQYFNLKQKYEVDGTLNSTILKSIQSLAKTGYNYLPDNLNNKNYLNDLESAIQKGLKSSNDLTYTDITKAIENYLYDTSIEKISGTVSASPTSGNAPLNVTLRANVSDPSGTAISSNNYVWWIDNSGTKKIIGKGVAINYTLNNEGKNIIFLDVISSHRNSLNYIDTLPFRGEVDINVNQKLADLSIKVNSKYLGDQDSLKFSTDEASYGLLFDATSSTPTTGGKFLKTSWDFGNGTKKSYTGSPKIQRVTYATSGEYNVTLNLQTNEGDDIERNFIIYVNKPVAIINASQDQGYIGDKFTFSADTSIFDKNATYNWKIIDIDNSKTISEKTGDTFTYTFSSKGKFNIELKVTSPDGTYDNDNKIIYINSRAPVADFSSSIPKTNKPNSVLFDATSSYDEDYTDDGKLNYSWQIDGQEVNLENPTFNGAIGYYTFDSIGNHSVTLEVSDPDGITDEKTTKVQVSSILSVDFDANPLVITRSGSITFTTDSKEAQFFNWDFGDGDTEGTKDDTITHTFEQSGTFSVKLEVSDSDGNTNSITKKVYVSDSEHPFALVNITYDNGGDLSYDETGCNGSGAYIVDRVNNIKFSGENSINVDGTNSGLNYSWKIGSDLSSDSSVTKKFDEIGCFPVKLTVKSTKNNKISSYETYVQVKNILPKLSTLNIQAVDTTADPVIVNVSTVGAEDEDGVIVNYLWYYYTDTDSEPQDYRMTTNDQTTFVLPKISGTYYFVVVLKDNNEETYSSENLGSKFYVTLSGDNVNTPIVSLSVNDSSVSVGDDVTFTATVKNVLGQDLTDKATYYWDFDGDGFYDKEVVGNGNITYSFQNAGTYHVKVKAKYKGVSNVKTLTVDVVNNLVPNFNYISIYDKFVFFNESLGKYDDINWNLGDGNTLTGSEDFVYTYYDGTGSHDVTLKISDGDKIKEKTITVKRNSANLIKVITAKRNNTDLIVFSYPEMDSDGNITLDSSKDRVFIYLGESKGNIKTYNVDYNTNYDSDLNGGKDDDVDNKDTSSYTTGDPLEITLDSNREQTIKITLKDEDGKVIDSKEITITKKYIEASKGLDDIVFTGITKTEQEQIQSLKNYISKFPEDYQDGGLKYLERLQEEWFDDTEKTKVILEFESYVDTPEITNSTEVINLLESILVGGDSDKSQKNVAYNALKNLITSDVSCTFDTSKYTTCQEYLDSLLETIKNSNDIDQNRTNGKIILTAIVNDSSMTDQEKEDFKSVLQVLIYGDEISSNTGTTTETTTTKSSTGIFDKILGIIKGIAYFILIIILLIGVIILGLYIYYRFGNTGEFKRFEDFILEKTKLKKSGSGENTQDKTKNEINTGNDIDDPFSYKEDNLEGKEKETENETNQDKTSIDSEKVPDWLKSSFSSNDTTPTDNNTEDNNQTEITTDTDENNKDNNNDNINTEDKIQKEEDVVEEKNNIQNNEENDITKIDETEVPDWLKDSLSTDNNSTKTDDSSSESSNTQNYEENTTEDNSSKDDNTNEDSTTKPDENIDNTEVPDWLKDSLSTDENSTKTDNFSSESSNTQDNEENTTEDNSSKDDNTNENSTTKQDNNVDNPEVPDWLKDSLSTDDSSSKDSNTQNDEKSTTEDNSSKTDNTTEDSTTKQDENIDNPEVPDWLKPTQTNPDNIFSFDDDLEGEKIKTDDKSKIEKGTKKEDIITDNDEKTIINKDNKVDREKKSTITKENDNSNEENENKKENKVDKKLTTKKTKNNKNKITTESTSKTKDTFNTKKDVHKKEEKKDDNTKNGDELWDDGMDVPDWLKTDDKKDNKK